MPVRTALLLALPMLAATGAAPAPDGKPRPSFLVTSPTYPEFAFIDKHSAASERDCGGQNLSPALSWSGEPASAKSFAILYQDPDGNNGQGEAHWLGYNIAPTVHALPEGGMTNGAGMTVGLNDRHKPLYYGPCPPYGKMHHYVFGVYALDLAPGELAPGLDRPAFLAAIKGHTVAYQSIVFVYQRPLPANGIIPKWTPPE